MLSAVMLQDKRQKKDPSIEEELLLTHKLLVSGRGRRAETDDFKTFNPKCFFTALIIDAVFSFYL